MMKTTKKLLYAIVLMVTAAFASCEGPEGPAGPAGEDGVDGQDGNANVQTYIYNNPSWMSSGSGMLIRMDSILTDDVIENDAVLVYLKHTAVDFVSAIPGSVWVGSEYRDYALFLADSSTSYSSSIIIVSMEMDGSLTPNDELAPVEWVKVVIIESTSTTVDGAKSLNPQQEILYNLDKAGVDVNDYYQVMNYFGLDY